MYTSKLKQYKRYYKSFTVLYTIFCFVLVFFEDYSESFFLLFDFLSILYIVIIGQMTFFKQDNYIEKNYKEVYKRYMNSSIRPIAITFRLLNYNKINTINDMKLPDEIVEMIAETRKLIRFMFKVYLIMIIYTFVGIFILSFSNM